MRSHLVFSQKHPKLTQSTSGWAIKYKKWQKAYYEEFKGFEKTIDFQCSITKT